MKISTKSLSVIFLLSTGIAFAQTNKEVAWSKAKEAVKLMDNGKFEESRKILSEAQKLDSENSTYQYEIGYSYYLEEKYETAIIEFEKTEKYSAVTVQLYQLWGNAYDIIENPEKAFEIYNLGLKKFSSSGILYLEKGNVYNNRVSAEKAISFYEKGIEVDPGFASNYYRAALHYLNSSEQVWGMIYGEIFINLEPTTKRTDEISKLLFDTYKKQISFKDDSTTGADFCTKMVMYTDQPNRYPFCMTYVSTLLVSMGETKVIDLNSLNAIRKSFIENYFFMKRNEMHPNVLFDFLKTVLDAGHLEAYNYWLLKNGNSSEYNNWRANHLDQLTAFVDWWSKNYLVLDNEHKFYQNQY